MHKQEIKQISIIKAQIRDQISPKIKLYRILIVLPDGLLSAEFVASALPGFAPPVGTRTFWHLCRSAPYQQKIFLTKMVYCIIKLGLDIWSHRKFQFFNHRYGSIC